MKHIVVQLAERKFVVAVAVTDSGVYRRCCETRGEFGAKVICDALNAAKVDVREVA